MAQESISRYTRDFERRAGLFPLYWDAEEARLLLEIPRFDEEFLYLTSLATGLGSNRLGLDRGMIADEFVARFERHGGKVLLVLAANEDATVESRAAAEWGLRGIAEMMQTRIVRLPEEEAHHSMAAADIQRFLSRPAEVTRRSTPLSAPPASPIGSGRQGNPSR